MVRGKREELREALRQESASPCRWCDLGEALLEDGQKEKARYCFQQAEKLAPNLPPIWMRAAFFHFQMEETDAAIQCSARVLKIVPDYDQVIFNYYDRLVPSVEEVLPHLGDNRRAGQAYFRHLWDRRRRDRPQKPGSGCGSTRSPMTRWPLSTSTCFSSSG